ncbi:MAG: hypothetical protein JST59_02345 [Actinobacteria bacterium]|nr:hypothetical protein [Actinomycetota bacterium]
MSAPKFSFFPLLGSITDDPKIKQVSSEGSHDNILKNTNFTKLSKPTFPFMQGLTVQTPLRLPISTTVQKSAIENTECKGQIVTNISDFASYDIGQFLEKIRTDVGLKKSIINSTEPVHQGPLTSHEPPHIAHNPITDCVPQNIKIDENHHDFQIEENLTKSGNEYMAHVQIQDENIPVKSVAQVSTEDIKASPGPRSQEKIVPVSNSELIHMGNAEVPDDPERLPTLEGCLKVVMHSPPPMRDEVNLTSISAFVQDLILNIIEQLKSPPIHKIDSIFNELSERKKEIFEDLTLPLVQPVSKEVENNSPGTIKIADTTQEIYLQSEVSEKIETLNLPGTNFDTQCTSGEANLNQEAQEIIATPCCSPLVNPTDTTVEEPLSPVSVPTPTTAPLESNTISVVEKAEFITEKIEEPEKISSPHNLLDPKSPPKFPSLLQFEVQDFSSSFSIADLNPEPIFLPSARSSLEKNYKTAFENFGCEKTDDIQNLILQLKKSKKICLLEDQDEKPTKTPPKRPLLPPELRILQTEDFLGSSGVAVCKWDKLVKKKKVRALHPSHN